MEKVFAVLAPLGALIGFGLAVYTLISAPWPAAAAPLRVFWLALWIYILGMLLMLAFYAFWRDRE